MKNIIYIILGIIYLFSFVSHNTVMALSHISGHHPITTNLSNLSQETHHSESQSCSVIVDNNQNIQLINENTLKSPQEETQKSFQIFYNHTSEPYTLKHTPHIPPPPYISREIQNYAYTNLIKIIKSNT